MKVHYINILLFALPLSILVSSPHKHPSITHHTQANRTLCECELYSPANYDNDPQMKEIIDNFNKQTQQRFHEYDERLQEKRNQCKDKCDKESQKIILKDKLEKQMEQHLTTLETKINTDDIPTCICEKSLAEKVEKGCLQCGYGLGTVAPTVGLIGSVAVNVWKPKALAAAIAATKKAAASEIAAAAEAAGIKAGKEAVIAGLQSTFKVSALGGKDLGTYFATTSYNKASVITQAVYTQYDETCLSGSLGGRPLFLFGDANRNIPICQSVWNQTLAVSKPNHGVTSIEGIKTAVQNMVSDAEVSAKAAAEIAEKDAAAAIEVQQTNMINTIFMSKQTAIIASIIAILIIVLIMVIIYLILRYRRKKKMKKKLQYIKLLEE
ncbi:rifin PIR protein, putative [Plasmodium reichenowi]|uniref:Rifin PIR protein, putative n=1 Tax=Plasmodium reichenowi TaxID=5854 RepID=A0A2P9D4R4_PLARE|nr:rifin PIR protein, putative [Plasmodium reichenowi]